MIGNFYRPGSTYSTAMRRVFDHNFPSFSPDKSFRMASMMSMPTPVI